MVKSFTLSKQKEKDKEKDKDKEKSARKRHETTIIQREIDMRKLKMKIREILENISRLADEI